VSAAGRGANGGGGANEAAECLISTDSVNSVLYPGYPRMQAVFVDIGLEKAAFLPGADFSPFNADEYAVSDPAPEPVEVADAPAPPVRRPRVTPPIEERLQKGQDIIVQISKEPIGTKGARVTSNISLPGRYLVYLPFSSQIGISRRIASEEERQRLREAVEAVAPDAGGIIIRTACEGVSKREIQSDLRLLRKLWTRLARKADTLPAPALLHQELDVILRTMRDLSASDVTRVVVDNRRDYQRILDFIDEVMPRWRPRVELYELVEPIFERYGIEAQIAKALERMGVSSQFWAIFALEHLGWPDRSIARARDIVALARRLAHPFSIAAALLAEAIIQAYRGDEPAQLAAAAESIAVSEAHGFPLWLAFAWVARALVGLDASTARVAIAEIEDAIAINAATGNQVGASWLLASLADAQRAAGELDLAFATVDDALAASATTQQPWWDSELHRVRGELLAVRGADAAAEAALRRAVDVARGLDARTLELRAATSLARVLAAHGRRRHARALVEPLVAWFTEGFETRTFVDAKALLAKL
jgi:tetratricopeptide (TPR) repeat protein